MKKRALIIGGYDNARLLAESLVKLGYRVTMVNMDRQHCEELAEMAYVPIVHGDGTKPEVLQQAGAADVDLVVALTPKDSDNLVACELCKKEFRAKRSIALLHDPKKSEYFYRMGIDAIVCAVNSILSIIEQESWVDTVRSSAGLKKSHVKLTEVHISNRSPVIGKKLWEIDLPQEVLIVCILRGDQRIVPRGENLLYAGDTLLLMGTETNEAAVARVLTGNGRCFARKSMKTCE